MKSQHHAFVFVLAALLSACSQEEAPSGASGGAGATETPATSPTNTPVSETAAPKTEAETAETVDAMSPVGSWTLDPNASLDFNVSALLARAESITPEQEESLRNGVAMVVTLLQMDLVLAADNTLSGTSTAPSLGGGPATSDALTGTWALDSDVLSVTTRTVGAVDVETLTGRFEGAQLVLRMEHGATPLTLIFVRKR